MPKQRLDKHAAFFPDSYERNLALVDKKRLARTIAKVKADGTTPKDYLAKMDLVVSRTTGKPLGAKTKSPNAVPYPLYALANLQVALAYRRK